MHAKRFLLQPITVLRPFFQFSFPTIFKCQLWPFGPGSCWWLLPCWPHHGQMWPQRPKRKPPPRWEASRNHTSCFCWRMIWDGPTSATTELRQRLMMRSKALWRWGNRLFYCFAPHEKTCHSEHFQETVLCFTVWPMRHQTWPCAIAFLHSLVIRVSQVQTPTINKLVGDGIALERHLDTEGGWWCWWPARWCKNHPCSNFIQCSGC